MSERILHVDTVVLDIDGTLLDSNYHHTVAWQRAFRHHDVAVPCWRIHRALGMGGDRLVTAVAGEEVEERLGDAVRDTWEREYGALLGEPALLPGARELLDLLRERGLRVVLASSAIPEHAQRAFELLDAEDRVDAATTSEDASASKPDPELVEAAVARVEGSAGVLVGDSVWDVRAGQRAGIPTVGVCSGGFSRAELVEEGAVQVLEDAADLARNLDRVLAAR